MEIRSTWFGAFLLDGQRIVRELRAPQDPTSLKDRLRLRRQGLLTPEEEALIATTTPKGLMTHDRRFLAAGVSLSREAVAPITLDGPPGERLRELLLETANDALRSSWDPSVHLDEAVRTMGDVDRTLNLIGERLASWASRDRPQMADEDSEAADRAARTILDARPLADPATLPGADPELLAVRRALAETYDRLRALRRSFDSAVEETALRQAPNLSALLGPILTARLLSQAGGLDRLARLPASTVQVLGAESAFFEHLRRGTRPPRHGLLFLHPLIQSAPSRQHGRLARALAGKAAIAARLDKAGRPVNPAIGAAFARRVEEIRRPPTHGVRRTSRAPLDRTAQDR